MPDSRVLIIISNERSNKLMSCDSDLRKSKQLKRYTIEIVSTNAKYNLR